MSLQYLRMDTSNLKSKDLIKQISENANIFIIGNNSINSIAQAEKMLKAGANGISIARAAIGGKLNFDLNEIRI